MDAVRELRREIADLTSRYQRQLDDLIARLGAAVDRSLATTLNPPRQAIVAPPAGSARSVPAAQVAKNNGRVVYVYQNNANFEAVAAFLSTRSPQTRYEVFAQNSYVPDDAATSSIVFCFFTSSGRTWELVKDYYDEFLHRFASVFIVELTTFTPEGRPPQVYDKAPAKVKGSFILYFYGSVTPRKIAYGVNPTPNPKLETLFAWNLTEVPRILTALNDA